MSLFSGKRIYLDYASATPMRPEAQKAMLAAEQFSGNPGAIHAEGVAAARSLAHSRERIARLLACKPREVLFTSGLTESNNLAILGVAQALDRAGKNLSETHWVVSGIEHPSVLECFAEIERLGGAVTHVDPEQNGVIAPEKVARALRKETVLVSIGWGNSEIGTMQPLADISRIIRAHAKEHGTNVLFHSDAGQAPLYRAPVVHTLGVDLFSLGSGKLYGPRGVGALYIGSHAEINGIFFGGAQERGLRPGTEPVALAAGFAEALECAQREREKTGVRLKALRDALGKALVEAIPGALINGDMKYTLPHMLNISVPRINAEYVVLALDRAGIAISTKAACSEGNRDYSHVVAALDTKEKETGWRAKNTLRISLGNDTSEAELRRAAGIIVKVVAEVVLRG